MLAFYRRHVAARLTTIWLVVVVPLSLVLLVTYYEWYSARISLVEQERQGYAQSAAATFQLLLADMRFAMRSTGSDARDSGPSSATSTIEFRRLMALYPVANVVYADPHGRVIGSDRPGLIGMDVSHDTAFKKAMQEREGFGIEPSEVSSAGVVGFHVAGAIPARSARPSAVVMMLVDVRRLHARFPLTVPVGGISIIDSRGQVVFQNEDVRFALNRARWGSLFPSVRQALHGRVAVTSDFAFPGDGQRIAAFLPIRSIGWAAGSSVLPAASLVPFYQTLAIGFPIAVAIGIVALFVSISISRGIRRSLAELADEARRIGSGELDAPVRSGREDEIGDVARSLEAARVELQDARGRTAQELETTRRLLDAVRALAAPVDLGDVLDTVAHALFDALGHSRAMVFLWDETRRMATVAASAGERGLPVGTTFPFDALSSGSQDVIERKQTNVIDYDALPLDQRGPAEQLDTHLSLLVPMVQKGRLVGAARIDDPGTRRPFTQREIEICEGIAAQAAVAIENARLYGEQARGRVFAERLDEVNRVIHSSLVSRKTMQTALESAGHTLEADAGVVFLAEGGGVAQIRYQYGLSEEVLGARYDTGPFPFAQVLVQTQEPVALRESQIPEAIREDVVDRFGIRSLLAIPLLTRGRIVGGIGLVFRRPHDFTPAELDFGRKVGSAVSLSIENGRLYETSRRELARTTVLRDVAAAASALDVREAADRIIETGQRLLGATSGVVYALNEAQAVLRYIALRGYPEGSIRLFEEVALDHASISGQAVLRDELLAFAFDELPEGTRTRAEAVGVTTGGWVAIPAHAHGKVVGCITLTFSTLRHLDDEDLAFFRSIGDQLGVALENGRLFEAERQRAAYGRSMVEINADLGSSLDIDETLPSVLEKTTQVMRAMGATVVDRVEGGWRVRQQAGMPTPEVEPGSLFPDEQAPSLVRVLDERASLEVADVETTPADVNRELAERAGYRAFATYPLIVRGEVTGGLIVFFAEPRHLSGEERDYLRRVAFAVSLAEENSRLFKVEHRVAETLQTALLALPDRIPGVEFAHLYRSATEAARVGGDFYDLFEIGRGRVGITIGDISGHGIDAAVLTSLVKNAIRVQATQEDKPPNEVMASASRVLFENSAMEIFATVFFGVLDLSDGCLVYCSAGHTTGACICSDGGVSSLAANSPLIGAFAEEPFEVSHEHLNVHDLLFLYTDGLTEARRDRRLFGEERLFELLGRQRGGSPERTLREVAGEVLSYARGRLSDDLAILAVQRSGPAPRQEQPAGASASGQRGGSGDPFLSPTRVGTDVEGEHAEPGGRR